MVFIQRRGDTPILCLTARDNEHDVIAGLNCGADDYLKKPFAWDELEARCRALIRRSLTGKGAKLYYADLCLDPVKHRVWRGCREVNLTHKEYRLLETMMRHPETVLPRRSIAEGTWEAQKISFTNIIDVYVNYLRKKIDADRSEKLIHTIRGQGYMLRRISLRQ
ncbi:MAG: response regulator transcription factor [Desulfuromonadales bacterium]|nr:response regulator transcription factor [Desulfuromonadales bacterium]MBN2793001.1 response regulator transcription factor [Desulfuromonadales bacterium]